jgi:hypothetical protein
LAITVKFYSQHPFGSESVSALAEQLIGDWLKIRKLTMAQPNIVAVVNHLQGIRDEVALIPNIPAAGNIDALQQQFGCLRQEFGDFGSNSRLPTTGKPKPATGKPEPSTAGSDFDERAK